ncbi:chemotaxis protein CheW [Fredinandcohnia sp. 179-A 10B2 NHS]|uniref:chemotaxis protein CheW n=1 Tax=Fredinandcohnia sp. 179-A 10B2 NHS TaxID=3235176 RepID=UPI0039A21F71
MLENNKVVVFTTGSEEYAVPIRNVISIERFSESNVIPHMPSYMLGVLTIRDELVPIIDTGVILFNVKTKSTENTRIIVIKTETLSVGLVVDDAKEILDIQDDQIKGLNLTYQLSPYITGVATLEDRLITLLDPASLFQGLDGFTDVKEHIQSHH